MAGLAIGLLKNIHRSDFTAGSALVDRRWHPGERRDVVVDPATANEIADVARCSAMHADLAIAAAGRSFDAWRDSLPAKRGAFLRSWASLMLGRCEELAIIVTSEQGKPLAEARHEIACGAGFSNALLRRVSARTVKQSPAISPEAYFRFKGSPSASRPRSHHGISLSQ